MTDLETGIYESAAISFRGHQVIDTKGDTVGTVTDVLYDGNEKPEKPSWMVVNPGIFRSEHYVPIDGAYATKDDRIVVPFDKRWIKAAPKASGNHVLDAPVRRELQVHYKLV